MKISIIIPTYNEEENIEKVLTAIRKHGNQKNIQEVIVVDNKSSDNTTNLAKKCKAKVINVKRKGRGSVMNNGAFFATGQILYFLHADSIPPLHFDRKIINAVTDTSKAGCFRLKFDNNHWFLRANGFFTRFDVDAFRFGDQSLFVTTDLFKAIKGFDEQLLVMEDNEIVRRIKRYTTFTIINDRVTTSSRKYVNKGIYKLQSIFTLINVLYYLGVKPQSLITIYRRLLK